jgi:hypothetical protein
MAPIQAQSARHCKARVRMAIDRTALSVKNCGIRRVARVRLPFA